jgi:hypothetical protein
VLQDLDAVEALIQGLLVFQGGVLMVRDYKGGGGVALPADSASAWRRPPPLGVLRKRRVTFAIGFCR